MYFRPVYFMLAGVVVTRLGRSKGEAAETLFEAAGTLLILAGVVDLILHR